jgi:hypothetical protein
MMDDYLKFRPLHQGSPAGIEQCERTYLSLLSSLRHNAPRALTRDAVEWWLMAELERGNQRAHQDSPGAVIRHGRVPDLRPESVMERLRELESEGLSQIMLYTPLNRQYRVAEDFADRVMARI